MLLLLLLAELHRWRREAERQSRNLQVMKKQAAGAQAEYQRLAEQSDKSKSRKGGKEDKEEGEAPQDSLEEQVTAVKKELRQAQIARADAEAERDHAQSECKSAQLARAAVEKQAEAQSSEYVRLVEENAKLRDLFRGERKQELEELDKRTADAIKKGK